jgi:dTDP-4-dehydrorhamnose reductase
MRVLVTGVRGLLGAAIERAFSDTQLHAYAHHELDVTSEPAVAAAVADVRPDVVINCAAYNDVDGAEDDSVAALRTNAFAVLNLARAARETGATFVHYSTDFVFDGETDRPYREDDAPNPHGVYATSKLVGEWFAVDAMRAYVLRVESLFGRPGPSGARRGSLGTIVDRIRSDSETPVFVDRTVSPTYTTDVAEATRSLIERGLPFGTYHCVNAGAATWLEIAQEAARLIGRRLKAKPLTVTTANLKAPRPRYCALSSERLASAGIVMPRWEDALGRYIESLITDH